MEKGLWGIAEVTVGIIRAAQGDPITGSAFIVAGSKDLKESYGHFREAADLSYAGASANSDRETGLSQDRDY